MFEEIFGLPMHILVNHAVIVFVPLTVMAAVVYAVVPRWRWALRWPLLAGAVVSLVTGFVARQSGAWLLDQRYGDSPPEGVALHQDRGTLLVYVLVGLLLVVAVATFTLGGPSRLVNGRDWPGAARPVQIVVVVLLVAVAVYAGVQVVLTGDAGARSMWG